MNFLLVKIVLGFGYNDQGLLITSSSCVGLAYIYINYPVMENLWVIFE